MPAADSSASCSSCSSRRASAAKRVPASVSRSWRVVRTTSRLPSLRSSSASARVTVAAETPSARAAPARLRASATAVKTVISWMRSMRRG
jgi:hypothetical protein